MRATELPAGDGGGRAYAAAHPPGTAESMSATNLHAGNSGGRTAELQFMLLILPDVIRVRAARR
ncbi:hypothetical protein ABD86_22200 [Paenibacillus alvei]|nr:hypothetical protein [Paenibacillus alvei]MBG9746524.1 hypothetical protein [Paenibacillus alvei]